MHGVAASVVLRHQQSLAVRQHSSDYLIIKLRYCT
jgi:hypothetical protein